MRPTSLRHALLRWWDGVRRPLPWRRDRDPWRVWVAEVMLQQTRVEAVVPAYERFLSAFPSLESLARASEERALSLWSGLGYYGRARALHRAARTLCASDERAFPRAREAALRLPGVGAYTAAAVLSISYDEPLAAVDGNVVRVLSRLERLGLPDARGEPHAGLAARLLDRARPGDWNQALMELGQTVCLPRAPRCGACPLAGWCRALASGTIARHPPPRRRATVERRDLTLLVLRDRSGRLLLERGGFAHLAHLWLPPVHIDASHSTSSSVRSAALASRAGVMRRVRPAGSFDHAILHRRFAVQVIEAVVAASTLDRLARPTHWGAAGVPRHVERRAFTRAELASIGRSSLLTKSLALVEGGPATTEAPRHRKRRSADVAARGAR